MDLDYYFFNDTNYTLDYEISEPCKKDELVYFGSFFIPIFFSLVITLSLTGNVLALVVLCLYENMKSLTNIFIFNLAISDLVFTVGLPFWAIYHIWGWILSEALCKVVTFIFFMGFYSSILFLTVMTVYRYRAVNQPLLEVNNNRFIAAVLVSATVWGLSIGAATPYFFFSSVYKIHHDDRTSFACDAGNSIWKKVGVFQQNLFFLAAFGVIAFCYLKILKKLMRSRSNTRNRAVKLIFCIVFVFFVGWVPYNIIIFLRVLADYLVAPFDTCEAFVNLDYACTVCKFVAFSHCCLNPILYVFVGVKFKAHLKLLLRRMSTRESPGGPPSMRRSNIYSHGTLL